MFVLRKTNIFHFLNYAFASLVLFLGFLIPLAARADEMPALEVGVNNLIANSNKATLTGTVNDPSATIVVSLNGQGYTATNNGDGTWIAPESDLLPDGIYDVAVMATTEGQSANDPTTNELTIDTIAPVVSGISDGEVTNQDVTITFDHGTATLDGNIFDSGNIVSEGGEYTLIATDEANNSTTVHFTIDKTAPVVSGLINGTITNQDVALTFNEGTALLNDQPYNSGDVIFTEGNYQLVVTDSADNSIVFTFRIDKTAPIISGVTEGQITNQDLAITFSEGTATLNGGEFTSGSVVSAEGAHTLVVIDRAGNSTTIHFTIDKTAPMITGITDGQATEGDVTIIFDHGAATLDGNPCNSGDSISTVGDHTLTVSDEAGNSSTVRFTINQNQHDLIITGVTDGEVFCHDVPITFGSEITATLNGQPFTSGTVVSAEGEYTLFATDQDGNTATVHFTIDKTPPVVTGVTDGEITNQDVTISFDDEKFNAILNGHPFASGTTVTEEGTYVLIVTDKCESCTTTIHFTIDKTPPVVTGITNGAVVCGPVAAEFTEGTAALNGQSYESGTEISTPGNYVLIVTDEAGNSTTIHFTIGTGTPPEVHGATDGEVTNQNVTITFEEGNTATLNGHTFASGTTISEEGEYVLIVTQCDQCHLSTTIHFTIDKTPPVVTGITNGAVVCGPVTAEFNDATATLNGQPYHSGEAISANGTYTLIVTDEAGNSTTVHFTIEAGTPPVVHGVTDGEITNQDVTITFEEGNHATLNGNPFTSGTTVSEEGEYVLVVTQCDQCHLSTTVHFKIDKTSPVVIITPVGDECGSGKKIVFNEGTATLNGQPFHSGEIVTEPGEYHLVVTDEAGNETIEDFVVGPNTPPQPPQPPTDDHTGDNVQLTDPTTTSTTVTTTSTTTTATKTATSTTLPSTGPDSTEFIVIAATLLEICFSIKRLVIKA